MTIEIEDLSRTFAGQRGGAAVEALRGITLTIADGEIFGMLGPNGAGKTTLVRILSTLLTPTTGAARVAGMDVVHEANAVRRRIGVAFGGERGLYDRLSARDNLRFAGQLYGVHPRRLRTRIDELLETVGLADKAGVRVETFSRGMKQRLHIARALIHDPQILFLDEPSSGLDPVASRALRGLVAELRRQGRTILLTTHSMVEADELCDRVSVIVQGSVRRLGTPERLKSEVDLGRVLEVETYDDPTPAIRLIEQMPSVSTVDCIPGGEVERLVIRLAVGSDTTIADVLSRMPDHRFGRAFDRRPTLEDAYVSIIEADA
ncbi:ABC transporter ATP-binding protein [Leifsonia sp. F6_8S_P_1B]|uniref:ABC transporter ATP-binding protein n=1 Tax=Leifsonia williamsii TaxID=3035919 RepID=A0ABT8K7P6_9MICO|nr:ABC transporter ATP-binding protein [Leifsonia williamsii]MDN4613018.1 ABC transporter ATP-binding protein [Leifsonia williamsii]